LNSSREFETNQKRFDHAINQLEQSDVSVLKRILAKKRGGLHGVADERTQHIACLNSDEGINEDPHSHHPLMSNVTLDQLSVVTA